MQDYRATLARPTEVPSEQLDPKLTVRYRELLLGQPLRPPSRRFRARVG